jgi:nifR3 family TIM-barrel protein
VAVTGLKIGPIAVDPPVVLAPMAGVTNPAFRRLCRSFGAGLYVSEMVSARGLLQDDVTTARLAQFADDEPVRSLQLYGTDPAVVGAAVARMVDGPDPVHHIDLNMGCPSPKVTRRGGGAAVTVRPRLVGAIVAAAVRSAGAVPVTVKMRKGVDDETVTYLEAARSAEDAGVAAVALHARTAEQLYSGRADWDAITALKESVTSVPVLGNGDIWEAADAVRMVEQTGCDGVVVGRGCLGRPWLFRDLADAFAGRPVQPPPALGEVVEVMKQHARLLVQAKGDEAWAVRDFRKHTGWYLTGYAAGGVLRRKLSMASSLAELDALLDELDPSWTLPPGHEALPRGHSQGPKAVSLPEGWKASAHSDAPPDDGGLFVTGG